MTRRLAVLFVLLLAVAACKTAQHAPPASRTTLDGVVMAEGLTMPNVRVTISRPGEAPASVMTDEEGRYAFTVIAPATYDIEAELPGFGPLRQRVRVTEPTSLELQLPLRDGSTF